MKHGLIKLKARGILGGNNGQAVGVVLLYFIIFSAIFASLCFFAVCLFMTLKDYNSSALPDAFYYAVFSLSILSGLWLLRAIKILLHRWFMLNDGSLRIRDFFNVISLKMHFRVFLLKILFLFYNTVSTAFYFFPFSAAVIYLYYRLNSGGMKKTPFIIYILFLSALFLSGLYFSIVSMQKTAYLDECAVVQQNTVINKLFKSVFENSRGSCFSFANFKLSFLGWWLLSAFVIPLFFTVPYYLQSVSEFKKANGMSAKHPVKNIEYEL